MSKNFSTSCSSREDLPWEGTGASLDISGCRFSLYPMTDDFESQILNALKTTDTSKVWSHSDALSTVYRGKLIHVIDAVTGLFINAYKEDIHMSLEGQLSKGCPGDMDGDSFLSEDDNKVNFNAVKNIEFPVICKIALYPLGKGEYIEDIAHVFRMAQQEGLKPQIIHYATRIQGDVHKVFEYLESVCRYCSQNVSHYVLTFTLSVNSPTEE